MARSSLVLGRLDMARIPDCIARDIARYIRNGIAFPGATILERWADILENSYEEDDPLTEYQTHMDEINQSA